MRPLVPPPPGNVPGKRGDTPGGEGRAETRCEGGEKAGRERCEGGDLCKDFPGITDNSLST